MGGAIGDEDPLSQVEMRNPGLKKRLLERLDLIGLLAFSITVLFISFPNLLFSGNIEEIPKAATYYRYFFIAAFAGFLILAFIILFLPRRVALIAASLLSAYALLVIIFDLINPLDIGPIVEGTESVKAAPMIGVVQVILILATFFVIYYIPKKLRGAFAWSLAIVLLISGLPFLFASSGTGDSSDRSPRHESESPPDFNIYHIVFDAYYGPWLQWSLSELSKDTHELAGFTHYRRNVSNYAASAASFPSFMSGTMYSPDKTIKEWYQSVNESSTVDDLHERGFSTTYYGPKLRDGLRQVEETYIEDPGGTGVVDITLAANYWLLRVAPVALRHLVLDDRGAGPITRGTEDPSGDIRILVSYRQFKRFLSDERLRSSGGHYVHAYFYPPHGPYQMNRHGDYVGESSYDEQLHLATNMLLEFVETLKELGRFENSFIIVHADHGRTRGASSRYAGDPLRDFIQIDEATSEAISEIDVRYWTGAQTEARYLALLLLKPCGYGEDAGDLIVNDALVQLLDLREYIKKVIDEGDCSYAYPEREQIDIHHGLTTQEKRDGTIITVKRDLPSGHINHYIIRPDGKWEIGADIPFRYE